MILEINDAKTIADIREEFTKAYPFLCIEFYDAPHDVGETTSGRHLLPHEKMIGEVRRQQAPGLLEIYPQYKTGDVEQNFKMLHGLHVQIFRRRGDSWIQTAGTDELTLEEQNEIGYSATLEILQSESNHFKSEKLL